MKGLVRFISKFKLCVEGNGEALSGFKHLKYKAAISLSRNTDIVILLLFHVNILLF